MFRPRQPTNYAAFAADGLHRRTLNSVHPYLIHVGHFYLPAFGVLAAVGLMAALGLSERTAPMAGLNPEKLWDAGIFAILAAFLLSRALLIAANWHTFLNFPILLLAVPSLTPLGVFLAACATLLYLRFKRTPVLPSLDAWASCATLVWAALALGHFFEGSDPGLTTRGFPGLTSAGESSPHHPVALYAAGFGVLMTVGLYRSLRRHHRTGHTAAFALVLTGLAQFLLSFMREPGLQSFGGLDALQWVALAMIVAGGLLFALSPGWRTHHSPLSVTSYQTTPPAAR